MIVSIGSVMVDKPNRVSARSTSVTADPL
jgi:hypothetical protein